MRVHERDTATRQVLTLRSRAFRVSYLVTEWRCARVQLRHRRGRLVSGVRPALVRVDVEHDVASFRRAQRAVTMGALKCTRAPLVVDRPGR